MVARKKCLIYMAYLLNIPYESIYSQKSIVQNINNRCGLAVEEVEVEQNILSGAGGGGIGAGEEEQGQEEHTPTGKAAGTRTYKGNSRVYPGAPRCPSSHDGHVFFAVYQHDWAGTAARLLTWRRVVDADVSAARGCEQVHVVVEDDTRPLALDFAAKSENVIN